MATPKEIVNGITYYYKMIELGRDSNGKRIRKKFRAKTVRELQKKIDEYNASKNINYLESTTIYFRDFLKKWLYDIHMKNLKPSTKERYNTLYNKSLKNSSLGMIKLNKINALEVQNFYTELSSNNVSDNLIRNIHKLVRPCLTYAYANGFTIRDFGATGLIKLPQKKCKSISEQDVFTLTEQKKFINSIDNDENKALYITALSTGLRLGELLALYWSDIDFENATLSVNRTIKRVKDIDTNKSSLIISTPKTQNSIRNISLPDKLIPILKNHKKSQQEMILKLGNKYINKEIVFATPLGTFQDDSNVRKHYKNILKKNSIRSIKFHGLRHTFATRLFEAKVPVKVVSELLGHSSIDTTLNIYVHVLDELKSDAAKIINTII